MCSCTGSRDKRTFVPVGLPRGRLSCDGRTGINSVCRWRLLRQRRCRHCAPLCHPRAEILQHGLSPPPRRNNNPSSATSGPQGDESGIGPEQNGAVSRNTYNNNILQACYMHFNSSAPRRYSDSCPFFYPLPERA